MAEQQHSKSQRDGVGFREGYQGKKVPAGAKPVKSPAADVPVKTSDQSGAKPAN
jgi:hypothetical protein